VTYLKTLSKTPSTWAEGGDLVYTIVVSGTTYRVHEFKTVGTSALNVLNGGSVEYLVVAGGGGGGGGHGVVVAAVVVVACPETILPAAPAAPASSS
jgi:hypothetical protein